MSYVEWEGDWSYKTPGVLKNATMLATPISLPKTSRRNLQDLCDKLINNVQSKVTASPWLIPVTKKPFVILSFADFPEMRSKAPPENRYGYVSERDVAFFVPIELKDANGKSLGIRLINPFIWVTNQIGVLNGRETFGFPKIEADIGWDPDRLEFSVCSHVWETHGPNTPATVKKLLGTKWKKSPFASPSSWAELQKIEIPKLDADNPLEHARSLMLESLGAREPLGFQKLLKIPLVLLKQFRGIAPGNGADYQEVVGAEFEITRLRSVSIYPSLWFKIFPLELTINRYDSVDIAGTLGLPMLQNGTLRLRGPVVRVSADLELIGHPI